MTGGELGAPMDVLKVSSKSNPNSCAGALAGVIRHVGVAELQVVGAGALNQAIKAVAIARGFLVPAGLDVVCVPMFADIEIDGQSRTAIRLLVEDRQHRRPKRADDSTALPHEDRPEATGGPAEEPTIVLDPSPGPAEPAPPDTTMLALDGPVVTVLS